MAYCIKMDLSISINSSKEILSPLLYREAGMPSQEEVELTGNAKPDPVVV